MTLRDLAGAVHVHSDLSDGSSSVWEIVNAARFAGLDFVVLTDHDDVDYAGLAGADQSIEGLASGLAVGGAKAFLGVQRPGEGRLGRPATHPQLPGDGEQDFL